MADVQNNMFPDLARAFHDEWPGHITSRLDLGFDLDEAARDRVNAWIESHPGTFTDPLAATRRGKGWCVVFAPGPTLETAGEAVATGVQDDACILAVDGAARYLVEQGYRVDMVVSDLDGAGPAGVDTILDRGGTAFIHVHGDNMSLVDDFLARHERPGAPPLPVLFTTQVFPAGHVANLGGFTDGDRAIFTAIATGCSRITLVSMDVNHDVIGPYSKQASGGQKLDLHPVKREKLAIAMEIMTWLSTRLPAGVVVETAGMERPLPMFPRATI